MDPHQAGTVSRRSFAAGAARALPVVAASAAVPVFAASIPPSLHHALAIWKHCERTGLSSQGDFEIDGRGNVPDRGVWVEHTRSTTKLTGLHVVYYLPTSLGILSWTAQAGNSGWTTPTQDSTATAIPGYYAYSSTYSGTWSYVASGSPAPYTRVTGAPHVKASMTPGDCSGTTTLYVRRIVSIDGVRHETLTNQLTLHTT